MEGNHHITSMLESLLAKFDDQKALQDKQLEAQNAFNAQISQDLSNLAKQIDLTQANVDAAHEAVKGAASPSRSVTTVVPPPPPSLQVQAPLQQQLPPSPHTPPDSQRPSTSHAPHRHAAPADPDSTAHTTSSRGALTACQPGNWGGVFPQTPEA